MGLTNDAVSDAGSRPLTGCRCASRAGFTLLELSIVAAIIAVLGASLAAALSGGIRIWENIRGANDNAVSAAIAYELWSRDVRNSVGGHGGAAGGREDAMAFGTLRDGRGGSGGLLYPGRVEYVFDRDLQRLRRIDRDLIGGLSATRREEIILGDVREARFEFMLRLPNGSRTPWGAEWGKGEQLVAARLFIRMKTDGETAPMKREAFCMAAFPTNAP